ncbi:hypothetical protein PCL_11247 [Purpureocillium lilacinum]|uniref:Uncharacterized protein n=1 Tax=Purpureocillium lilacinum TaxID=33203 RepID=A0A2U3DQ04_PURLI|nr:hypothetical protein PCL_11247 [Purpureocillium lilacinum]
MDVLTRDNVLERFSKESCIYFEDAALGNRVKARSKVRFRPDDVDCLDFLKENVFEDERVQNILRALFPWAALIWYDIYLRAAGSTENNAVLTGQIKDMTAVVVQLWGPRSKLIIYKNSHLQPFRGATGSSGLLEIAPAQVRHAGCDPVEIYLEHGGLVIFDARSVFTLAEGFVMQHLFISREQAQAWPRHLLPNKDAETKVRELNTPGMGTHFTFGR